MERWREIRDYWFGAPGSAGHGEVREHWFRGGPAVDQEIRERFEADYQAAAAGGLRDWIGVRGGAVALVVLLDQFPRNMYRGDRRAFAADALARDAARRLVSGPHHASLLPVEKLFAYLPFEHSERLEDQHAALRLFMAMDAHEKKKDWIEHALEHAALIERFGRFPHRNAILGRASTPDEAAWLASSCQRFGTDPGVDGGA